MNNRLLKNKKFLVAIALGSVFLTGCNSNNKKDNITPVSTEVVQTNTDNATNTDALVIDNNSEFTELDINNDASIEYFVDQSFETYSEFYNSYGISKDQVRDIVFVLNDKYTDSEGKLIIDEDRASEAYMNIKVIIGQSDDSIRQKIDNINTILYAKENPSDETAQSLAAEIEASNDWKIIIHPTLVTLIDKNVAGGLATIEEISEWEKERDHQIDVMNSNSYDKESINNYVINQEITEYNSDTNNMNRINKNGQKFAVACANFTSLTIAAKENQYTIYLEGYNVIDQNIKINPTDEERFLENDVITLVQEGLIDASMSDSIISEAKSYSKAGYSVTEIEEILHEKYTIDSANLRLLVSYAHYLTTMANEKYLDVECDEEAETIDDIVIKRNNISSTNTRKLVLA